jgi:hypothetical protein
MEFGERIGCARARAASEGSCGDPAYRACRADRGDAGAGLPPTSRVGPVQVAGLGGLGDRRGSVEGVREG